MPTYKQLTKAQKDLANSYVRPILNGVKDSGYIKKNTTFTTRLRDAVANSIGSDGLITLPNLTSQLLYLNLNGNHNMPSGATSTWNEFGTFSAGEVNWDTLARPVGAIKVFGQTHTISFNPADESYYNGHTQHFAISNVEGDKIADFARGGGVQVGCVLRSNAPLHISIILYMWYRPGGKTPKRLNSGKFDGVIINSVVSGS
jgi:hypothetical protein